jgi:hypothetical protein
MTEDLERLMQAAQGQPPTDEFRARLRTRFLAAADGRTAPATDDANGEVLDLTNAEVDFELRSPEAGEVTTLRHRRSRRLQLLAVAAAVVIPLLGVWVVSLDSDDSEELVTSVGPTATVEPPDARALPLTTSNMVLDAGTYRVDTLGTAFTFDVDETAAVDVNENGVVSISDDYASRNPAVGTITFWRTPLLPDPASTPLDPTTGWPASDVEGWVGVLGEAVSASEPLETTLGDAEAISVALEFPCRETSCTADDATAKWAAPVFTSGSRYEMFVVDQGREDPIVVIVGMDRDDEAWQSTADALLSSLEFEPTEPNPVRIGAAGTVDLDAFGGISIEIDDGATVAEPYDGFARLIPPDLEGDVEFITRPLDTDGVEVTSVARLLQLLDDEAVVRTEVDGLDIDGVDGQTFEVNSGGTPNVVLKLREADLTRSEFGWESPHLGHLWMYEHPDRGLLIVSSEAFGDQSAAAPLRRWTEELLRTLEFGES